MVRELESVAQRRFTVEEFRPNRFGAATDVLVCSNPDELTYRSPRTKPLLVIAVADSSL